jgi:hypothetical protein
MSANDGNAIERKGKTMSRYIDADALLSKGQFVVRRNDYGEYFVTVEEINKMPTVDAVPVVRCRECKYHEDEEIGMVYCPRQIGGWVKTDWFCADGERKDDGN